MACLWAAYTGALLAQPSPERITVIGQPLSNPTVTAEALAPTADIGQWWQHLPGAAINRNGPVTPIAQYRGHYGDRVAVSINGTSSIGAGPNAMDAPLSYAPPIMVEQVSLYRGIAPVSAGIDTLGGAAQVDWKAVVVADPGGSELSAQLAGGYRTNGSQPSAGVRLTLASAGQGVYLFGDRQQGNSDLRDGQGRYQRPSGYEKSAAGVGYRYAADSADYQLDYAYYDTGLSATPALPMDIIYVHTHKLDGKGRWAVAADWWLSASAGYSDADHVMDNYRLRQAPPPLSQRSTQASSRASQWALKLGSADGRWLFSFDGKQSRHDAVISNPNNPMFRVLNFNQVDDRRLGLFLDYQIGQGDWQHRVGARAKLYQSDAGEVSHHMAAINPMIATLVNEFNQADRQVQQLAGDLMLSSRYQLDTRQQLVFELGVKQRGPSYQSRYLWLPMQSTGGLADGRTYIGDIDLKPETAWQLESGYDWQQGGLSVSPRLFWHRIDNYIQGIPSTNETANRVGVVMSGQPPLQFANVEAEIYGIDLDWHYLFSRQWSVSGVGQWLRGDRRDIDDHLYRIAPPSLTTSLSYQPGDWQLGAQWLLVAPQKRVSALNQEQATAGYGLMGLSISYLGWQQIRLSAGVDNLFDKAYADHLNGYNRAAGSELAVGERMTGEGRSWWARVSVAL